MQKREKYLKRIRPYYNSDLIKSLTGIRRAGKSTLLLQIMEEIKKENSSDQIIFFDFEDFDNAEYLKEPKKLDILDSMADIGATITQNFDTMQPLIGTGFLDKLK